MADPVLLIGAGGFVGQRLLDVLVQQGEPVLAVSRNRFDPRGDRVQTHVCAMREASDYAPLLKRVRAVVHVASASTPGSSAGSPLQELDQNLRPTLALLEALQAHPEVPLIYVSSGGTLCSRDRSGASDELAAVYSRSYHGAGKIAAEHFIEAWCNQFDTAAVVLRPSNLYGPGQKERQGFGIVPTALGKLVRGETLHVWGDGSSQRDYLYIDDFAQLLSAALFSPVVPGYRVFNACTGLSVDLNTLFALIEDVAGRSLHRAYDESRRVDAPDVRMQATRARETFGWTAQTPLRDGLERTWRWFNTLPR